MRKGLDPARGGTSRKPLLSACTPPLPRSPSPSGIDHHSVVIFDFLSFQKTKMTKIDATHRETTRKRRLSFNIY